MKFKVKNSFANAQTRCCCCISNSQASPKRKYLEIQRLWKTFQISEFPSESPVLQDLHWLPIEQRFLRSQQIFKVSLFTFGCLHKLAPSYPKNSWNFIGQLELLDHQLTNLSSRLSNTIFRPIGTYPTLVECTTNTSSFSRQHFYF